MASQKHTQVGSFTYTLWQALLRLIVYSRTTGVISFFSAGMFFDYKESNTDFWERIRREGSEPQDYSICISLHMLLFLTPSSIVAFHYSALLGVETHGIRILKCFREWGL